MNVMDGGLREGMQLEFKSAFHWNRRKGAKDGGLKEGVGRTVAGFLNSKGGKLIIGLTDEKEILGVEEEMDALFGEQGEDRFEQYVNEYLRRALFPYPFDLIQARFEEMGGVKVFVLDIESAWGVTYLVGKSKGGGDEHEVFVRTGNRTIRLVGLDRDKFVTERNGGRWVL